jgi:hypothetical protein
VNSGHLKFAVLQHTGRWRVRMTWPKTDRTRYFGRFKTESEAHDWIHRHRWMGDPGSCNIFLPGYYLAFAPPQKASLAGR